MMIRTMAGLVGLPVAGVATFATLSPSGEVHDMDRFTAYNTLKSMSFADMGSEFRSSRGGVRVTGVPGEQVVWTVSAEGGKVATIRAVLDVVDAGHTRVTLDTHAYDHPDPLVNTDLIRTVVEYGLEEKIDATLDGRPFDPGQLHKRMGSYLVSNPAALAEFQHSLSEQAMVRGQSADDQMRAAPRASSRPFDPNEAVEAREREDARRMRDASAPDLRP